MLNVLGSKSGNEQIIGLTKQVRDLLQKQAFDQISSGNVPYPGIEKINLLRTHDMPEVEMNKLAKEGLADLLTGPTQMISSHLKMDYIDMEAEARDSRASHIQIKILSYKTPVGDTQYTPKRFQFRFRFFTCSEFRSGYMGLMYQGGGEHLEQNQSYFL